MLFSILIANYNNGNFFKDCYDSIMKQKHQNFEVIIVDNTSTDDSVEVIENLIQYNDRFKLYKNEANKGCGFTKNKCAHYATGEIAGFLDPDDALTANALQVMVDARQQNPNASIIGSKYYLTDLQLNITGESKHTSEIPFNESYLTYGKGAISHFVSFKINLYNKTKGINPSLKRAVDQDLYYLLEEVGRFVFVDQFLYLYRINKNSISANDNFFKANYWHYIVMENAYKRRFKYKELNVVNLSKAKIKQKKDDFLLYRMQREATLGLYKKKYYFLFQSIINAPLVNTKNKLLCLFKLHYY